MSLRTKALLVVALTLVGLVGVVYVAGRTILLRSFADLERRDARRSAQRALDALAADQSALSDLAGDWSWWDDTYAFIEDANASYIETNLTPKAFSDIRVDVVLFVNSGGRLVHSAAFDPDTGEPTVLPDDLAQRVGEGSIFLQHNDEWSSVSGIVALPEVSLVLASTPIVTSQGDGPIRGAVIMGRYLDSRGVSRLAAASGLTLQLAPMQGSDDQDGFGPARQLLSQGVGFVARPQGADRIAAYVPVADVYGNPALILRVVTTREVYSQGDAALRYTMVSILLVGLAFAIVSMTALKRTVLNRLAGLSASVRTIGASGDVSRRITASGSDELTGLATAINATLSALQSAQSDLLESEDRYRTLVENHAEGIVTIDLNGRITSCYPPDYEVLGLRAADLLGRDAYELLQSPGISVAGLDENQADAKSRQTFEMESRDPGSQRRIFQVTSTPRRDSAGQLIGLLAVFRDITARREAEQALRDSEEKFRTLFEGSSDGILLYDGACLDCNEQACRLLGHPRAELVGHALVEFSPAAQPDGADSGLLLTERLAAASAGVPQSLYWKFQRKDGALLDAELSLKAMTIGGRGVLQATIRDISERMRLEAQFLQAQKMESIGCLAGGVAHDFNNLLTVIIGHAGLAKGRLPAGSPVRPDVDALLGAAERAANLTQRLLTFSRRKVISSQNTDLNTLCLDLDSMLRRLVREDIELVTVPAPEPLIAKVDPGQIEQALVNLVVNARDAMPSGGRITIRLSPMYLDKRRARPYDDPPPGRYVLVEVSDTGQGMSEEVKAHLFEPFFTTKEPGKGTGLGLATVFAVVRQHQGQISVDSAPGRGTTFQILLPREQTELSAPIARSEAATAPRGEGTVLIVEDEEAVRALAARIMHEHGFSVLQAGNGEQAMRVARDVKGTLDLLLTDVVMPGVNGRTLARWLKELRPDLRIIFMSGYFDTSEVKLGASDDHVNFIAKPFSATDLLSKVREVLYNDAAPQDQRQRLLADARSHGG